MVSLFLFFSQDSVKISPYDYARAIIAGTIGGYGGACLFTGLMLETIGYGFTCYIPGYTIGLPFGTAGAIKGSEVFSEKKGSFKKSLSESLKYTQYGIILLFLVYLMDKHREGETDFISYAESAVCLVAFVLPVWGGIKGYLKSLHE